MEVTQNKGAFYKSIAVDLAQEKYYSKYHQLFSSALELFNTILAHSRMGHYFFSYLLTWEVHLIEILEIMPQMWQYVIFLSLKPTKVTSDFILN